ncbi:MAG: large-conductance mechanosensitive channel protein MscL [Candidatus Thermoplasmatota archaeon]
MLDGLGVKVLREFQEFAMRGSVVDLAVGVIIGASFGKIVTSLVADIIMPPISVLLGNVDFTNLFVTFRGNGTGTLAEAKANGAITWNYGAFLNVILEFLIVAFAIFFLIKQINRLKRKTPPPPPVPAANSRPCPECTTEIPRAARRCPHCTSVLA